jgi:hypothetical protein
VLHNELKWREVEDDEDENGCRDAVKDVRNCVLQCQSQATLSIPDRSEKTLKIVILRLENLKIVILRLENLEIKF